MLWTGKRCEVVNLEEGTTLAPTPSFTESSPVVVPEPPTLTTGPTIPETPRPTASVPVVTCGDLDCRYVQNVVGILSTQHNTHTRPGSLFSLSFSLTHTLNTLLTFGNFPHSFFFFQKCSPPSCPKKKWWNMHRRPQLQHAWCRLRLLSSNKNGGGRHSMVCRNDMRNSS